MVKTSTRIVGALALAGALASGSAVLAAPPVISLDPTGDLDKQRTYADLMVDVSCDGAVQTPPERFASLSVKLYQSVGRLLNIATTKESIEGPDCTGGAQQPVPVRVFAIEGLKLQPGPATVIVTVNEVIETTSGTPPMTTTTQDVVKSTDKGFKVNLRP